MPLTPEYSYQETETLITVNVALRGASPKNCDVFVSDVLLKINKAPHLLVLDLHAAVDDTTSAYSCHSLNKGNAGCWLPLLLLCSMTILCYFVSYLSTI